MPEPHPQAHPVKRSLVLPLRRIRARVSLAEGGLPEASIVCPTCRGTGNLGDYCDYPTDENTALCPDCTGSGRLVLPTLSKETL